MIPGGVLKYTMYAVTSLWVFLHRSPKPMEVGMRVLSEYSEVFSGITSWEIRIRIYVATLNAIGSRRGRMVFRGFYRTIYNVIPARQTHLPDFY